MAWTTPLTAVANAALTAAQWNASVRDNLLETAVAKATTAGTYFATTSLNSVAERGLVTAVAATDTTTSTTYTDLTVGGPAATVTCSRALIFLLSSLSNNTVNADSRMGYDIAGATTFSATDTSSLIHTSATANAQLRASAVYVPTLTTGSNTFTGKYRVTGGTGSFNTPRIHLLPF